MNMMKRDGSLIMTQHYGFLTVWAQGNHYYLSYTGNMGDTIASVSGCFDKLYGEGAFANVEKFLTGIKGAPDYAWFAKITKRRFEKLIPGVGA
jgi:hypothetical protein